MGSQIVGSLGVRKFWQVGFRKGKIHGNKGCYRKKCSRIICRFEITIKRLYVRFMNKQKVTMLGSLKLRLPKSYENGVYNWP